VPSKPRVELETRIAKVVVRENSQRALLNAVPEECGFVDVGCGVFYAYPSRIVDHKRPEARGGPGAPAPPSHSVPNQEPHERPLQTQQDTAPRSVFVIAHPLS